MRNGLTIVAGMLVLGLLPLVLSSYHLGIVSKMLIFAIFATSLNLKLGYTGLASLGHAAYFGMAAYAVGLLGLAGFTGFVFQFGAGLAAALLTAALFGLIALRAQSAYFLMITLAMSQVLWGIAFGWRSFTGGDDGIAGVPPPVLGGYVIDGVTSFYYLAVVIFVVSLSLVWLMVGSHFGRILVGIREKELRMEVLGYNVWLYKYAVFVIAGGLAGISGILFAHYTGFVAPSYLSVVMSAMVLIMVILGGPGTLFGPALGAIIIVFLENAVSAYTERWLMILGAVYVLATLFAPYGLLGKRWRAKGGPS